MTRHTDLRYRALPHGVTSFVGRREETSSLKRALGESRLITLIGPGGVGKTRLALHVAEGVRRGFTDGLHFIELAKGHDPSLVTHAMAEALDLRDQSDRSAVAALIDYLADKHVLIVLDNCEHVLAACTEVVAQLLVAAPDLRVLATSREPLNISGERVWPVSPLSLPTSVDAAAPGSLDGTARQFEAVSLFEQRAAAVLPGFTLTPENQQAVTRLCARLDGLPLAIELAAVRMRVLTPDQMLARLEHRFQLLTEGNRSAPARHQTLQAAMRWSFDLCSETERLLWARCSVFAGEFDLKAAEVVCAGDGLAEADLFESIAGLVDKSILSRAQPWGRGRYTMLETIRQFGHERLIEMGSDARVRLRHRDYYLEMAERCDEESGSARQVDWAELLPADRANFFAGLDYCLTQPGEAAAGLRMGAALWFYWIACGLVRDGRHWLDRLLAAEGEPTAVRARALWVDGWATILQGDNARGVELLNDCLRTATIVDDRSSAAQAKLLLGLAKIFANDPAGAIPLLEDAVTSHRRRNEWTAPALTSLPQLGLAALMIGDVDRAAALSLECRDICDSHGERWVHSWVTWQLALTSWVSGDVSSAVAHARDALRAKSQLNDQLGLPFCMEILAWAAVEVGDPQVAATLFGGADALWERIGKPLFGYESLLRWSRENRDRALAALGRSEFEERRKSGTSMTLEEMVSFALDHRQRQANTGRTEPTGLPADTGLTRREREVAALVAAGLSNRDLARRLVISQRTAEAHVGHILTKLGFTSRAQIATWVTAGGSEPSQ